MNRRFATNASRTVGRYLSLMDKHAGVWERIFPKVSSPELGFYPNTDSDWKGIDYSLNVVWDMLQRKGKKIRPVLTLLLADIYQVPLKTAMPLAFFVETVHNCTLIIDDIEDDSRSRRGEPCAHLKFGVDNSINAGCLGYFLPARNLLQVLEEAGVDDITSASLLKIYLEEMTNIHLGLAWDIRWHGRRFKPQELPSVDNYLRMVESKTSVLLRIGFRLLSEANNFSQKDKQLVSELANLVGKSFQIQDDIINLRSAAYAAGRGVPVGEDITEGKITLMVIEHVKRTGDDWLLEVLASKTTDQSLIDKAIHRMEESGAIDYADQFQRDTMHQALGIVDSLSPSSGHKAEMKDVLLDLLERKT